MADMFKTSLYVKGTQWWVHHCALLPSGVGASFRPISWHPSKYEMACWTFRVGLSENSCPRMTMSENDLPIWSNLGFGVPCQFSADYLCVALNILNNVGGKTGYIERLTEPFSLLVASHHCNCLSYVVDIFTPNFYPDRNSADICRRLAFFLASPFCQVGALRMMPNVWNLWWESSKFAPQKIAVLMVITLW